MTQDNTGGDALAEAMKLPEVAALVAALIDAVESLEWCARDGRMTKSQSMLVEKWAHENRIALAPFTAAKETP